MARTCNLQFRRLSLYPIELRVLSADVDHRSQLAFRKGKSVPSFGLGPRWVESSPHFLGLNGFSEISTNLVEPVSEPACASYRNSELATPAFDLPPVAQYEYEWEICGCGFAALRTASLA
jgi:hypothetical protein